MPSGASQDKKQTEKAEKMTKATIKKIIIAYKKTGRIAFHNSQKKTVGLNGFGRISEREAVDKMLDVIIEELDLRVRI